MTSKTILALTVVVAAAAVPFAGQASAAPAPLDWKLCKDVARDWSTEDTQTECATVAVPIDYAKPDGRKIDIAVSRIRAENPATRQGAVVVNPGGPGGAGVTMPAGLAKSNVGGILKTHDLIGFDPRGIGYSDRIDCTKLPSELEEPPNSFSAKEKARFRSEQNGRAWRRCAEIDSELSRSLTTANIARDIDSIRVALDEKKISFFGVSWGTALGANYRSLYDGNVDRMLIESVMPPKFDLNEIDNDTVAAYENSFHDFATWIARYDRVYHFGTTHGEVTKALFALRDLLTQSPRTIGSGQSQVTIDGATVTALLLTNRGRWAKAAAELVTLRDNDIPEEAKQVSAKAAAGALAPRSGRGYDKPREGYNAFQNIAVICNEALSTRDFETAWAHREGRLAKYPAAGGRSSYDGKCANWPHPVQPWQLRTGTSPLQLVGHAAEAVTPIGWAVGMKQKIGGVLLTVEDDRHGSLSNLPCGSKAVDFFAAGTTSTGSCPGAPTPTPEFTAPERRLLEVSNYVPDAKR